MLNPSISGFCCQIRQIGCGGCSPACFPGARPSPPHSRRTAGRRRALALNRRAEEALDTYGTSIYRLAYSYLHSACDAEDILQDTLVQLLRAAPVFQSPAHEKAWLLRVAGNLSKNRLAYNRIRSTDELRDTLAAEEREDLSFVWDAVRALPVHYREVIHLFYHEGYSTAQIAKILNRRESTVRSHLRRGRDKLRELLKGRDDLETGI